MQGGCWISIITHLFSQHADSLPPGPPPLPLSAEKVRNGEWLGATGKPLKGECANGGGLPACLPAMSRLPGLAVPTQYRRLLRLPTHTLTPPCLSHAQTWWRSALAAPTWARCLLPPTYPHS